MNHAQPWGPAELQTVNAAEHIDATLICDLGDTPTVPAAAAALGVETDQIIKTLLFLVERQEAGGARRDSVVVISHGERRIDKGCWRRIGG